MSENKKEENKKMEYCIGGSHSPDFMEEFINSFMKVEKQINEDYRKEFSIREKRDGVVPPWLDIVEERGGTFTVELDLNMLHFIDMLDYVKYIYENRMKGKNVVFKVVIQEE